MTIVGVKIGDNNKVFYYNSVGFNLKKGLNVIVQNDKGMHLANIVDIISLEKESGEYDKIIRVATKNDFQKYLNNIKDASKAMEKCIEIAKRDGLNMNVLDAYFNLDKSQLIIRFLADERVDFRNLAKELGSRFKTRIELRQIGIRDKAREVGGLGPCGRFLCCSTFLTSFDTVSINMAKNQGLALNPSKINGVCGRLLCCLNYENDAYLEARKGIPEVGKKTVVDGKEGKVITSDPLRRKYKVLIDNEVVEVDKNDSKK